MDSSWISTDPRPIPAGRIVHGRVRVPPSKSVTHRHLAMALLSGRETVVRRPLRAADTDHFLAVLGGLGWVVEERDEAVRLVPPSRPPDAAVLDCGSAGTLARFLVALLTVIPGRWTVDGSTRLRERPVGALVTALRRLGAKIEYDEHQGHLPLTIQGGTLGGGEVVLDAGVSSQYLSALMLAGQRAAGPITVKLVALTSAPYVAVTEEVIASWGGSVERMGSTVQIGPTDFHRKEVEVEGDDSAAAYPSAAAVLTGGWVELEGLAPGSRQGDRGFMALLSSMGARVEWVGELLRVEAGGERTALGSVDLSSMPDQVPTLAAVAALTAGRTTIAGVAHLRIKESDRLHAMATELQRLGFDVEERPDGLEIEGEPGPRREDRVEVESWDDHRIAMSLALVGLCRPGVWVRSPEVVAKSYPSFWGDLASLTA